MLCAIRTLPVLVFGLWSWVLGRLTLDIGDWTFDDKDQSPKTQDRCSYGNIPLTLVASATRETASI